MRVYAVGDIHGQKAGLDTALALIAADRERAGDADASVVFVGDLVAKGPDSRGVVETLMAGQAAGQPWLVLKGNHDRMFSLFLDDPEARDPGMRSPGRWIDPDLMRKPFGRFAREWMAVQSPRGRTVSRRWDYLEAHILPTWEHAPLISISWFEVEAWSRTLTCDETTVGHVITLMSQIMTGAVDAKHLTVNPLYGRRRTGGSVRAASTSSTGRGVLSVLLHILSASRAVRSAGKPPVCSMSPCRGRTARRSR